MDNIIDLIATDAKPNETQYLQVDTQVMYCVGKEDNMKVLGWVSLRHGR